VGSTGSELNVLIMSNLYIEKLKISRLFLKMVV